MQDTHDLDLIIIDLVKRCMERGEDVYLAASGVIRGKIDRFWYHPATYPHQNWWPAGKTNATLEKEPCIIIDFTPSPRDNSKMSTSTKLMRKEQNVNVPVRVVDGALFLQKIGDKMWMINVNSSYKG